MIDTAFPDQVAQFLAAGRQIEHLAGLPERIERPLRATVTALPVPSKRYTRPAKAEARDLLHLQLLRDCARRDLTRKEACDEIGIGRTRLARLMARGNIQLRHASTTRKKDVA